MLKSLKLPEWVQDAWNRWGVGDGQDAGSGVVGGEEGGDRGQTHTRRQAG